MKFEEACEHFWTGFGLILVLAITALGSLFITCPAMLLGDGWWYTVAAICWPIMLGRLAAKGHLSEIINRAQS
jgi:hypothetical protein